MLSNYLLGGSKGDGPELFNLCSNFAKKRFLEGPKHKTLGIAEVKLSSPGSPRDNSLSVCSANHFCKLVSTSLYLSFNYILP